MAGKKLFIVVDYQNDFVTGSLGFPQAQEIAPQLAGKIREYRRRGDDILFTFDTHDTGYLQTQEGKWLPVEHTLRGTWGWELAGEIAGLRCPKDPCIEKPCFGAAGLFGFLQGKSYEAVELAGVVSYICVLSNAVLVKTALPDTPVVVDARCTAAPDPILQEKAFDVMQALQIEVCNR